MNTHLQGFRGGWRVFGFISLLLVFFALSGCAPGSSGPASFTVAGTITGLNGTITVETSWADTQNLDGDGTADVPFTFTVEEFSAESFEVTVTPPGVQVCTVTGGVAAALEDLSDVQVACEDKQFFAGGDAFTVPGVELWVTDGTAEGTMLVKDIFPTPAAAALFLPNAVAATEGSYPEVLPGWRYPNLKGRVFFRAYTDDTGYELWASDGTEAGTGMVKDIYEGAIGSEPACITRFGDQVVFQADDGTNGYELWASDGTEEGTILLDDILTSNDSSPCYFAEFDGELYFAAYEGEVYELWKTDGIPGGATQVETAPVPYDVAWLTAFGGALYFAGTDSGQVEVWKYDGSDAAEVINLNGASPSYPFQFTVMGDSLYFGATGTGTGVELYRSDGTQGGTVLLELDVGAGSGFPDHLAVHGDTLVFSGGNPTVGSELWVSDGTSEGTVPLDLLTGSGNSFPADIVSLGGKLVFSATDPTNGRELWSSDGTLAGSDVLVDICPGSCNGYSLTPGAE